MGGFSQSAVTWRRCWRLRPRRWPAPALVLAVNAPRVPLVRRTVEGLLAAAAWPASLSRTSVVVGALATAIAMMASVGIMVGSFRETVALWLDTQLRADLYVRVAGTQTAGERPALPPALPAILASTPGVAAVDLFYGSEFHYRGERATLGAGNMEVVRRYGRLRFLPGEGRDAILRSLADSDRAIASEPFANKFGVHAGDRLTVPIGERNVTLTVAGIYYDTRAARAICWWTVPLCCGTCPINHRQTPPFTFCREPMQRQSTENYNC